MKKITGGTLLRPQRLALLPRKSLMGGEEVEHRKEKKCRVLCQGVSQILIEDEMCSVCVQLIFLPNEEGLSNMSVSIATM